MERQGAPPSVSVVLRVLAVAVGGAAAEAVRSRSKARGKWREQMCRREDGGEEFLDGEPFS